MERGIGPSTGEETGRHIWCSSGVLLLFLRKNKERWKASRQAKMRSVDREISRRFSLSLSVSPSLSAGLIEIFATEIGEKVFGGTYQSDGGIRVYVWIVLRRGVHLSSAESPKKVLNLSCLLSVLVSPWRRSHLLNLSCGFLSFLTKEACKDFSHRNVTSLLVIFFKTMRNRMGTTYASVFIYELLIVSSRFSKYFVWLANGPIQPFQKVLSLSLSGKSTFRIPAAHSTTPPVCLTSHTGCRMHRLLTRKLRVFLFLLPPSLFHSSSLSS